MRPQLIMPMRTVLWGRSHEGREGCSETASARGSKAVTELSAMRITMLGLSLRGLSLGIFAAAVAVPWGRADDIGGPGQRQAPAAIHSADEAWNEAGICGMPSPLADAERSFQPYPIDLCGSSCGELSGGDSCCEPDSSCEDASAGCCGLGDERPVRRFYITGILGASFATLQSGGVNAEGAFPNTGRAVDNLFTAGGAVGTAIDRSAGLLRLEVEGRGRDILPGQTNSFEPPTPSFFYAVRAADGWSVMANAWRDWYLTDRLGFYGGGGIGAGGYRLSVDDGVVSGYGHMGSFAWQAGTGTTYQITKRTTLDLGYRFFETVPDSLPLTVNGTGGLPAGSYVSNFYASELLLSVRIYEPFRSRSVR